MSYRNSTGPVARVRMTQCIAEEPILPADIEGFEAWCESGRSGRPIQNHIGHAGTVLWINPDGTVCVEFYDGDQRLLYPEEIEYM